MDKISFEGYITINNLPYSNYKYIANIRQRNTYAPNEKKFWSDSTFYNFETDVSVPKVSPRTFIGAYHLINKDHLSIFWENVDQKFQGAPNFTVNVFLCKDKQVSSSLGIKFMMILFIKTKKNYITILPTNLITHYHKHVTNCFFDYDECSKEPYVSVPDLCFGGK